MMLDTISFTSHGFPRDRAIENPQIFQA